MGEQEQGARFPPSAGRQKAAATKASPRARSGVTVPRWRRAEELWLGGRGCGRKSGAKAPHSKLGGGV